jgi:hypothetical protein
LEAKTNEESKVSVSMTPQDVSKTTAARRFEVQFNTLVTRVSQDMAAVSLSDSKAPENHPTARGRTLDCLEGDRHHRHGVLVFASHFREQSKRC